MKDEKKGDYVITKDHVSQTLEVGGKNKNPKEADYVLRDNTDYPVGNAIPFWLMGMLFWPRGTKRLCFPNWACKAWDEWI